jgi:hypothetical protein
VNRMPPLVSPILGSQRESDAQRRVDQAVRFGVWACAQAGFPHPTDIQSEFGVSRRTASRWRKSLARALAVMPGAPAKLPPERVRALLPTDRAAEAIVQTSAITAALSRDPSLLSLSKPLLVRDVRARYPGVGERRAKRAVNDACLGAAVEGDPHGTRRPG